MQTVIQGYLDKVKVGRKQSHRNLAIFPLLSGYTTALDYMTLDEALGGRSPRGDGGQPRRGGSGAQGGE